MTRFLHDRPVPETAPAIRVAGVTALPTGDERRALARLLVDCVAGGASIGFLAPLSLHEADQYWESVGQQLQSHSKVLFLARETATGHIVGAAQLALESRANGRHRAEAQKVMVLPSHRRRGIAAQLMREMETHARGRGVSLIFLDTSDGAGGAREFYAAIGYTYVGGIPGYALDPDGTPAKNAIYFKTLV